MTVFLNPFELSPLKETISTGGQSKRYNYDYRVHIIIIIQSQYDHDITGQMETSDSDNFDK